MSVGILAFGSIIEAPGAELYAAITRRFEVQTPFTVEFARSSRTRDGAPTLVPVTKGGAHVLASILVLDDSITVPEARAMLYRREAGRPAEENVNSRASWIAELTAFRGLSTCLYVALRSNIWPLDARKLAEFALHSATGEAGADRRDGISYLQQQKRRGVLTPLMPPYEEAILRRTGARNLDVAWKRVRSGVVGI